VTADSRHRSSFELLRFGGSAVSAELAVVELEGRFAGQRGRFARPPLLVIEQDDAPRVELAPVRSTLHDERWRGSYAVPLRALDEGRFALGARGTLLELPAPDWVDDGDRLAALARDANGLRRRVEALEDDVAAARADADAARAALDQAVADVEQAVRAETAQRIDDLEREVVEAHKIAGSDAAQARKEAETARSTAVQQTAAEHDVRVRAGERLAAEADARAEAAEERARAADQRAEEAEDRARVEAAGAEVLRAELAEERERAQGAIEELLQRLEGGPGDPPTAQAPAPERPAAPADPETTQAPPVTDKQDETRPIPLSQRPAGPRRAGLTAPPAPEVPRVQHGPSLSPWVAVGALALFAFIVLGLALGFLG
jgi:hypothetical protein